MPMEREAQPGRAAPQRGNGLQLAIEKAGGIVALARGLGISQPSVSAWHRIPADRVLAVEALTGVAAIRCDRTCIRVRNPPRIPQMRDCDEFLSVEDR